MLCNQNFIPSPHFSLLTIWDFPSFCQLSWRHVDFSTRLLDFFGLGPGQPKLSSLELQIHPRWQGLGSSCCEPFCAFRGELDCKLFPEGITQSKPERKCSLFSLAMQFPFILTFGGNLFAPFFQRSPVIIFSLLCFHLIQPVHIQMSRDFFFN